MTTRTRPSRYCSCGRIVAHGIRCECQRTATRARNRRHDANRESGSTRYPAGWRKARLEYLAAHPYCVMAGCGAPATTVDHIIPWRGDRVLFWNRRNWQSLCTRCHNSTKQRMERRPRP